MNLTVDPSALSPASQRRLASLERTAKLVTTDRPKTHGDAEIEMGRLAAVWSGLLQHKLKEPLTEFDAATMMVTFKACRAVVNPMHVDSWDDAAGYGAIGAGIAEARKIEPHGSKQINARPVGQATDPLPEPAPGSIAEQLLCHIRGCPPTNAKP